MMRGLWPGMMMKMGQLMRRQRRHICRACLNKLGHTSMFTRLYSGSILSGRVDKYDGITVDLQQVPHNTTTHDFSNILKDSLEQWRLSHSTAIWLRVPIMYSHFIAPAAELGFTFHHAEEDVAMLCQWLPSNEPSRIPRFASHQVGVAGFVYREDSNEALVIQDKHKRQIYWKFPGGLSDLGEDIGETAVRETFEETGIHSEFMSVMSFRQQHQQPGAFGRSDFYFICRLRPITFDIQFCPNEVAKCRWMELEELANHNEITPITKQFIQIAQAGIKQGFDSVDITPIELKSVYKGLKYKMYHRTLPNQLS